MVGSIECYLPKTINGALQILSSEEVIVYSGGTDLMVRYKNEANLLPKFDKNILYIGQIKELQTVKENENELIIGAGCTFTSLLKENNVPDILKEAIIGIASLAIRNIGTIGGNVCNASPAGDTLPVLYGLNTKCRIISEGSARIVNIEDFIYGPRRTILEKNEILESIIVPNECFNKMHYEKVGARKASAISKLSFTGLCRIKDNNIEDLRLAFGAVAATVIRVHEAEELLIGKNLDDIKKYVDEAIKIYKNKINPIDDQRSTAEYRKKVVMNLIKYFLNIEIRI